MTDIGPAVITNRSIGLRARGVRIIWKDGFLYIARTNQHVRSYPTPPPVRSGNSNMVAGDFTFSRAGCGSCGYHLGKISAEALIAVAQPGGL